MSKELHGKTLKEWKEYAASHSSSTPIQVRKYIEILEQKNTELKKEVERLNGVLRKIAIRQEFKH